MMLIDTHAHLDNELFDGDREAMIRRALDGGVDKIITIGTNPESWKRSIRLSEEYEQVYAVIGPHPTDGLQFEDSMIDELRKMAAHEKVVALGEIGLDYYWKETPPPVQYEVFRKMLRLACELDLPVVIHNREADSDLIRIVKEEKKNHHLNNLRGIMHCFSGDEAMLRESLELNFYVSFAGNVTYKKSHLPEVVSMVPDNRLLIETDAPYLTPVPFRGKRNEPAYVRFTAKKISEILDKDEEIIGRQTSLNACSVFGLV
ncbi:TatD family hydrolase [bacterium]|nr:TatD family hydrolase [bacterium]